MNEWLCCVPPVVSNTRLPATAPTATHQAVDGFEFLLNTIDDLLVKIMNCVVKLINCVVKYRVNDDYSPY